ncbi:protein roadkill [Trichonephila clavipes]|uniref:Protein roadkill n=1 Tax=Trichonephila clavipes TaxID=2585209 RepID=A0A8X7BBG2_TRICX|nr:protein roadkill [Trichonephila clavipes]
MDIEKKSKRFYWKIENFDFYFLTQTEPLKSPPFQIAGVGPDAYFRLALHKEIREKDVHVGCFLNVSKWSARSETLRIDGAVTLKMPNGIMKFVLQGGVLPKFVGSSLLVGRTTWSDTMSSKRDFAKSSVSLMCYLWKSPLYLSRQCSAVTLTEKQKKRYIQTLRVRYPYSTIQFYESSTKNSEEFFVKEEMWKNQLAIVLKEKKYHARVNCTFYLVKNSNVLPRIAEIQYRYNDPTTNWRLLDLFPRDILEENNPRYFKNSSVSLRIEAEMSFYEECGSSQEYFSDSPSQASKTFRHSLKNDLEIFFRSNLKGCDVILRCENQDFSVHKSLLCCKSPVFSAMFESDMKEKKLGIVEMDDTDSLTLNRFIEHLYLGSVTDSPIDLHSAMALYEIAHRYSILDLINYSRKILVLNIDCGNRDELLQFANFYEDKSLENLIENYFRHEEKIKGVGFKRVLTTGSLILFFAVLCLICCILCSAKNPSNSM